MMKTIFPLIVSFLMVAGCPLAAVAQEISATEIIRKADEKFNGEKSSYSEMSLTVVRPSWQRIYHGTAALFENVFESVYRIKGNVPAK